MTTVLVVDDSSVDRRRAGGLLEKRDDFSVDYAENGSDALRKLQQAVPDVVVTDLQMPELNGLELVSYVRSTYPLVPVILMTAHGSEDIAVEALEQGRFELCAQVEAGGKFARHGRKRAGTG